MPRINVTHARLIEDWVADILREYEALTEQPLAPPMPILDITERLFGLRCDIERLKGRLVDTSGVLIPEKRWILLNKQQASTRLNFTLAHEVAHWLVECGRAHHHNALPEHICALQRTDAHIRESTADYVAGALLMPQRLLLNEAIRLGTIGDREECELASAFSVSRSALEIRLEILEHELRDCGVEWRPSESGHYEPPWLRHRSETRAALTPLAAVAKVESPVVDHDLYRKLKSMKPRCGRLFVLLDSRDDYGDDVFAYLDCVDGVAFFEGGHLADFPDDRASSTDSDVMFCKIVSGTWFEPLLRDGGYARGITHRAYVVALRGDDRAEVTKEALLDIGRYIQPTVKLNYRRHARHFVRNVKEDRKRVVIATGCFDLLTRHHVRFLKYAKQAGDILIVGIEDDTRVRAFKGPLRPVNTVAQRVEVVEALEFVDFVFVISGSPKLPLKSFYSRLHKTIGPDVLAVTEGDPYLEDRRYEIEAAGGQLVVLNRLENGSSTSVIGRLLAEREYSDLILVSKHQLKARDTNHQSNWRQLRFALDDFA